jgi:hypothetical protein
MKTHVGTQQVGGHVCEHALAEAPVRILAEKVDVHGRRESGESGVLRRVSRSQHQLVRQHVVAITATEWKGCGGRVAAALPDTLGGLGAEDFKPRV